MAQANMSTIETRFDEACYDYARGTRGFRSVLSEVRVALRINSAKGLTDAQVEALKSYRNRLYIQALANLLHGESGGRPLKATIEKAAIILAKKGYSALAQDKDDRRTKMQEQVLTNMKQAWSTACRVLDIPAIDARGGARPRVQAERDVSPAGIDREAGALLVEAQVKTPRVIRLLPPPDLDEATFAADMCNLMERYLTEHPSDSRIANAMRNFIAEVSKLAAPRRRKAA